MALQYTSVNRIYDLEPMIGSVTTLTSSQILTAFAEPAEARMNAVLARNYTVPVDGTVPILQSLADDISVYFILAKRIFPAQRLKDSAWPDRFKEALTVLDDIGSGKTILVNSAGTLIGARTDIADVKSNTSGYQSTFHEGADVDQVQDPDKIDDLLDARDLI